MSFPAEQLAALIRQSQQIAEMRMKEKIPERSESPNSNPASEPVSLPVSHCLEMKLGVISQPELSNFWSTFWSIFHGYVKSHIRFRKMQWTNQNYQCITQRIHNFLSTLFYQKQEGHCLLQVLIIMHLILL